MIFTWIHVKRLSFGVKGLQFLKLSEAQFVHVYGED